MTVMQECPECKTIQKLSNKKCMHKNSYGLSCGTDLQKAKKNKRVKYHTHNRLNGKQKKLLSGTSLEVAKAEDGKIKSKKKENRVNEILNILPGENKSFQDLTDWYLDLSAIKELASDDRVEQALKAFNSVFGNTNVLNIKQIDLEDYQYKRAAQGKADATIDMEIKYAKAMVTKAFDNDEVDGRAIKSFRKIKMKLKQGKNARKTIITYSQYLMLLKHSPTHYKPVLIIAFNTGMRLGEIKQLRWSYIDLEKKMIRLPSIVTKEDDTKDIPINHNVENVLKDMPRYESHDYVISYRGKPMNGKNSLKKQFKAVCDNAGIIYGTKNEKGIIFKDSRRTAKTNMLNAGIDKIFRDSIVGHRLEGMDEHYLIVNDKSLTNAMAKYTKWFDTEWVTL